MNKTTIDPNRVSLDPNRPLPNLGLHLNLERTGVVTWAQQIINQGCLILDTETIDLPLSQGGKGAEVCQLALLKLTRAGTTVVFNKYIKPSRNDWAQAAIDIHGITPEKVKDAPTITDVWVDLLRLVSGVDHLVIFNRAFDIRALRDSLVVRGIKLACQESQTRHDCWVFPTGAAVHCALLKYSSWVQTPKRGQSEWKWQKLPSYPGCEAHSAIGDCQSTAKLIQDLASVRLPTPTPTLF
jgi:inhibitor of KinA sporulation pathway (predicted exonuclease)